MDQDRVEGTLKEGAGKVKEEWGDATDDKSTEWGGKADQVEGNAQQGWGDAKETLGGLGGGDKDEDRG